MGNWDCKSQSMWVGITNPDQQAPETGFYFAFGMRYANMRNNERYIEG